MVAHLRFVETGLAVVVTDIHVLPSERRNGLGSALLAAARVRAGALPLYGVAFPGERASKALFESAGMPAQLLLHAGKAEP